MTSKTETSDAFPGGVTTTYTYNGLGQVLTQTGPAVKNEVTGVTHTSQTRYTYDDDGNALTQTLADTSGGDPDRTTTYTYDDHGRVETVTDPEGGTETYGYDTTGARTDVTDPSGAHYTYGYTARGELASRTLKGWTGSPNHPDAARDVVLDSYAYDPGGRLASHTDAMGRTLSYTYYGDDRLAQTIATGVKTNDATTGKDVVVESRDYDGAGHLTTLVTGGGKTETDYAYDPIGNLTSQVVDPDGLARRADYKIDVDNNVIKTTRTDAGSDRQEVTDYTYDQLHRLLTQTVENGDTDLTTTYTRNRLGQITSVTDPRGNTDGANAADYTTTVRYDPTGQPVQVTSPPVQAERDGGNPATATPTTWFGYDTAGERTQITDPEGRTTTTAYDKAGRPVTQTSPSYTPPSGSTITPQTTLAYDAAGRVTGQTDGRGHTRHYTYDQVGNLARVEDPQLAGENSPGTWTADYDLLGEQLSVTDPTGAQTQATYDDLGRQVTATVVERKPAPAAYTTKYTYDDAGNLTAQTRPAGDTTGYTIDPAGEITAQTDPLGNTTVADYDLDGRLVKVTDPLGNTTVAEYDPAGRQTSVTDLDADGSTLRTRSFGYDPAGNRTRQTTGEGHTIQRTYDAANHVTRLIEPVTDTTSITTTYGYDTDGERTRLTDGRGNTTTLTYNTLGLPESIIEPATAAYPAAADRTWTTSYDAAGNPVREDQPGGVRINRTYDELDRVTKETGSGAEAATSDHAYGYDLAGRLLRVAAPGQDIIYTYNDESQPLSATSPTGQNSQFGYDPNGRLATRTDASGQTTFGWNGNDALTQTTDTLTGQTATRDYDDAGRLTTIGYTSGVQRSLGYDALNRVTSDQLKNPAGSTLASATYAYDHDDHLTGKTTTGTAGAGANTYTYDQAGRLTGWTDPTSTTTGYGWDDAGNRTQAGTTTYTYDQRNQLTADSNGGPYTYTPRGTLASQTSNGTDHSLAFDAFDRLINDGNVGYTYDSLDRVATRTQAGTTSDFVYATTQNDPAAITDDSGTVQSAYSRTPGGTILSLRDNGQNTTAVTDPLHGDLTATLTPDATTLTGSTTYSPFGATTARTGQQPTIGYQGEYTDPTTGRIDMAARWYTPGTGTFASRDTWTLDPDPSIQANRYTYANGDPLDNTDPSGHLLCVDPVTAPACAGAEIGSGAGPWGTVGGFLGGLAIGGGIAWWAWSHRTTYSSPTYGGDYSYLFYHNSCNTYPCLSMAGPGGHTGTGGGHPHGSGYTGSGWRPLPPPPPSLAEIQRALEQKEITTPVPRPPTKPGITQKQLDKLRDAVEKSVKVATGSDNTTDVLSKIQTAFVPSTDRAPYSPFAGAGAAPSQHADPGVGGNGGGAGSGTLTASDSSEECPDGEILTSVGCEDPRDTLSRVVNDLRDQFINDPESMRDYLHPKEINAANEEPFIARMNFGKAIERAAAEHPDIERHFLGIGGKHMPDFVATHSLDMYEVTTDTLSAMVDHFGRSYVNPIGYVTYPQVPYGFGPS